MDLKQRIRVVVSVAVSFLFIMLLVQNYRHQRDTDQRLAEMQRMVQTLANGSVTAGSEVAASIHEHGSVDDAGGRRDLEEILNRGWKLVDQRSPNKLVRLSLCSAMGSKRVRPMPNYTTALAARFWLRGDHARQSPRGERALRSLLTCRICKAESAGRIGG